MNKKCRFRKLAGGLMQGEFTKPHCAKSITGRFSKLLFSELPANLRNQQFLSYTHQSPHQNWLLVLL